MYIHIYIYIKCSLLVKIAKIDGFINHDVDEVTLAAKSKYKVSKAVYCGTSYKKAVKTKDQVGTHSTRTHRLSASSPLLAYIPSVFVDRHEE